MNKIYLSVIIILYNNFAYSQGFWTEVNSGVTSPLYCASNINGLIAWVCGGNGVVLKTSNTGYNWQSVGGSGIPSNATLINIFGLSDQIALTSGFVGNNTFMYRTSNGGANWTPVFTQPNGYINAVWMFSNLNGIMVGDPVNSRWTIFKTSNGGINWDSTGLFLPAQGSESGQNNSLWVSGNNVWFGTSNSRIYYSSNSGTSWIYFSIPLLPNSYSIGFNTFQYGYASGESLQKTTNNGINWNTVTVPGSGLICSVVIDIVQYSAWFARDNNNIYYSFNNGFNWSIQYTAPSGNFNNMGILRSLGTSTGYIYAIRSNGGISRYSGIVEGVKIISGSVPKDFYLYQNYPNPFNSETHIRFETPKFSSKKINENRGYFIRLAIYNIYGQVVEKRVAEVIQPGTYEDVWNGSQFSSGVYFYRLTFEDPSFSTGGSVIYTLTKKMILLK